MARPVDSALGEIGTIIDNLRAEVARLRGEKIEIEHRAEENARRYKVDKMRCAMLDLGFDSLTRLLDVPSSEEEPFAFIERKIKTLIVETNRTDVRSDAEGNWFRGRVCTAMRTSPKKSDDAIIDELVGSLNLGQNVNQLRADLASARESVADVVERSVDFKRKLWEALKLAVPADEEDAINAAKAVVESNRLLREKNEELERRFAPDGLYAAYFRHDDKIRKILDVPEETKDPLAEIESRVRNLVSQARSLEAQGGHAVYVNGVVRGVQKQSWAGIGATKPSSKLPGERNAFRRKIYKLAKCDANVEERYVFDRIEGISQHSVTVAQQNADLSRTIDELHHQVRVLEKRVVAVPNLDQTTLLMAEQAREQELKRLKRDLGDADKTIRRISDAIGKFVSEKDKSPLYDIVEQIEKLGAKAGEHEELVLRNHDLSKTLDGLNEDLSAALSDNQDLSEKLDASHRTEQAAAATAQRAMRSLARIEQMMGAIVGPVLDLPRIEEGVKSLVEMKRLATSSTYGKAAAESHWALETFKGRLLGALRMDSGSEDTIVKAAESLYATADKHFYDNQALKADVGRLKTALNAAYGKFGTKAEGELPTL